MSKSPNALMIAFGKPKDHGSDDGDAPDAPESGEDVGGVSDEEVDAFAELKSAMGEDDPEVGATALKNFINLCMEKGY